MGWTSGFYSRQEVVEDVTRTWENEHHKTIALKKFFSGNDLWVVFERTFPDGKPADRFIVLFMIRRYREGDWYYKDCGEECGPFIHSCPPSFFELAPEPVRGEGYHDFRQSCREYWQARNDRAARRRAQRAAWRNR